GIAPAPKGFFDDLPPPVPAAAKPAANLFDDLPAPTQAPPAPASTDSADAGAIELDLGPASAGPSLELDRGGDIDLGAPASSFGDLDLSEPTAKPAIQIKTPSAAKPAATAPKSFAVDRAKPGGELELEGDARGTP